MSLLAAALAASQLVAAAPVEPQLTVDLVPRELTVGERVEATLTLRLQDEELGSEPRFPTWGEKWGEAEILEEGGVEPLADVAGYRQRLVLTIFRPGETRLPPPVVELPMGEETLTVKGEGDLVLQVRSVLPAGEELPAAKPPAPPRALPTGPGFWWAAGLLSLGCLAAAVALARKQTLRPPSEPVVPPFAEFVRGLEEASVAGGATRSHSVLSRVLRRYLGRSLVFPAVESTTTEIHRRLLAQGLPSGWVRNTVELLRACDRVKFAREEVKRQLFEERRRQARDLGDELQVLLRPDEPAP